ncbi:hypothetical protein C0995_002458 [Termitomyces sp. Mi166|nr:hypothetical protein C0995_002458 [Termitomyces sp. Mi166\
MLLSLQLSTLESIWTFASALYSSGSTPHGASRDGRAAIGLFLFVELLKLRNDDATSVKRVSPLTSRAPPLGLEACVLDARLTDLHTYRPPVGVLNKLKFCLNENMGNACSRTWDENKTELVVRLQHGITGGFAGPDPDEIHIITKTTDSPSLLVRSLTRLSSSSPLIPSPPKHVPLSGKHTEAARLLTELRVILAQLPTEKPIGSEDIYDEDTSLAWHSDDFSWFNGGPDGCGPGGKSRVQATEKQREKFKRAIEIVRELVKRTV